jgi:hypothetical protein
MRQGISVHSLLITHHSSLFSMPQLKIAAVLAIAIFLQLSVGSIWSPLSYIDFPLMVVVYIALQRRAWHALIVGTIAGLAIDAAGGGLIGAGGFSKTLTANSSAGGGDSPRFCNLCILAPVSGISSGRAFRANDVLSIDQHNHRRNVCTLPARLCVYRARSPAPFVCFPPQRCATRRPINSCERVMSDE